MINRRNFGWLLALMVGMAWATYSIYPVIVHQRYYLIWQPPQRSDWVKQRPTAFDTREACLAERERSIIQSYERKLQWHSRQLKSNIKSLSLFLGDPLPPQITKLIMDLFESTRQSVDDVEIERQVNRGECVAADDRRLVAAEAAKLTRPPASSPRVVPYTPGRPIVALGTLNDRLSARLILDTGADRSVIAPSVLLSAGVDLALPLARTELRGLGGKTNVPVYTLDLLEVAGARVRQLSVASLDLGLRDADGLLGRDFLDQFHLTIDPTAGAVQLAPR